MLYATPADLLARYAERDLRHITDADGQAFVEQRAADALADASVEIDAYVGQRYLLPLQQPLIAPIDPAAPLPAPVRGANTRRLLATAAATSSRLIFVMVRAGR